MMAGMHQSANGLVTAVLTGKRCTGQSTEECSCLQHRNNVRRDRSILAFVDCAICIDQTETTLEVRLGDDTSSYTATSRSNQKASGFLNKRNIRVISK